MVFVLNTFEKHLFIYLLLGQERLLHNPYKIIHLESCQVRTPAITGNGFGIRHHRMSDKQDCFVAVLRTALSFLLSFHYFGHINEGACQ